MESKRYYNENPQVTALKELREKDLEYMKKAILLVDNTYRKKLSEFNKLPWFKKMFFKFEV
jgi:hypothetical protein